MQANAGFPPDLSRQATLERLEFLAWLSDSAVRIPGTSRTVGIDGVLSLIPGVGTLLGTGMSLYVVAEALRHGAPARVLSRMGLNIAADTLLGSIPVIGVLFDFVFKANKRNLDLLHLHLKDSR